MTKGLRVKRRRTSLICNMNAYCEYISCISHAIFSWEVVESEKFFQCNLIVLSKIRN
jgi:hypothetical protein